jgi:TrmH family RNA methyltransferase
LITSPHNEQLKEIRKLAGRKWRDKLQRFVAEGEDLVDAASAAGYDALLRLEAGKEVAPHVLAAVSSLGSGTRVLGVYAQRWVSPSGLCVCLWGVGDPGNVGTVLRSALAFGAGSVALAPGSADPYGPKAVRASMGAIFSVGVARVRSVEELPGPRVALVAREGAPLDELPSLQPGSIVVGSERDGLSADVVAACDAVAHIPIASESLNAAMAATVALYELNRSSKVTYPSHEQGQVTLEESDPAAGAA